MTDQNVPKRRHHFVPRFYMRAFGIDDRRIHLLNLPRLKAIPAVSLRDQCYQHRFYGSTNQVEDKFAEVEAAAAPVFAELRNPAARGRLGNAAHSAVLDFIAIQLQRTQGAVARAQAMITAAGTAVFNGPPPPEFALFDLDEETALTILIDHTLPEIRYVLSDLGLVVVHAPSETRFITSDHPAVKFNNYCAGTYETGVMGADCRGLEIVLPISPTAALVLYDREVYHARDAKTGRAIASSEDVLLLNRLQVFGARENLYFSQWEDSSAIAALAASPIDRQRVHVALAEEDEAEGHEFIAVNEVLPNLPMDLSCLPVRRGAARMTWAKRIGQYRHKREDRRIPLPRELQEQRRFTVREHHYFPLRPVPGHLLRSPGK